MIEIPDVSVVIPLYNKEYTIERTIESILLQGISSVEIIVVDDGSTDASTARLERFSDKPILLIRQPNAGPGSARNTGARAARAPLIAFLDADDEWRPGFLETGMAALRDHPEAVAYACGYDAGSFSDVVSDKVSQLTKSAGLLFPPSADSDLQRLKDFLNGLHSSATIVRSNVFDQAGGYYDRDRCVWGEDSYLWAQVLFMGPIYWDPTPRLRYHVEDSSLGFAVKYRERARPLAISSSELTSSIPQAHRPAFRKLAKAIAIEDAEHLMRSGKLLESLAVQVRHRSLRPRTLLRGVLRYAGHGR